MTSVDKTAIVTGAARGIGLATARQFLSDGVKVACVDRDEDELRRATAGLNGVLALPYDVSVPDQVAAMVGDTLSAWGRVDALVNNAGVADFGPIEQTTFERWRTVMATNLDGVFLCTQAGIPALKETKGAIVNIASISGVQSLDAQGCLWHVQGGGDPSDETAGGRTRGAWHTGQLRLSGAGAHQACDGGAQPGDHRRLSRCHSAEPLWP